MRSPESQSTRQVSLTTVASQLSSFVIHHYSFVIPLALLPALSRWWLPQLPDGADTASHFFRAVEIDWLIRHGVLYSRWLPDFVFGYGYPLFNFYGPLANYLIVALHLIGLPFVPATLAAFALADLVGAFGVYLLGRDTLGKLPGLVAAIAYAYSPYTLGSLHRGTLPETLAFGLLPFVLWAFYHLWHEPHARWLALSAFLLALLPPINNPGAALGAAMLVLFLGVLWIANRDPHTRPVRTPSAEEGSQLPPLSAHPACTCLPCRVGQGGAHRGPSAPGTGERSDVLFVAKSKGRRGTLWRGQPSCRGFVAGAGIILGLALSAFFWLPLVFELQYVQIARAYSPTILNFRYNFLSLDRLFLLSQPVDPNLIGGSVPAGLGLPQLGLAIVGLFGIRQRTREQKILLTSAAVAVLGLTFLTLPQSTKVWESIPGLSLIQFPARLLGPASLLLALLSGSAFCGSGLHRGSELHSRLAPLAVALIILFGFGWMYVGVNRFIPAQPTLLDIHAHEHRTGSVGTTTAAEFLPIWVEQKPPDDSLQAQYAESPIINRLEASSLPPDAKVISETPGLLSQKVELDSPADFTAVFNLFYFPGWAARIDGQAVSIAPTSPAGLISFPVPAGRHTLELRFADTPPRALGNLVSLAALVMLIVIGLRTKFPSPIGASTDGEGWEGVRDGAVANQLVAIAVIGLAALVVKIAILDRTDNLFHQNRFDGQTVKSVEHPLDVAFGDQMQLLGYDEQSGEVALYWRALHPLDTDWSISVALDYEGHRVAQHDAQHPAGLPTGRWFPDQYARDVHALTPIPGTPPGAYDLRVTVYRQSDGLVLQPSSVLIGSVNVPRSTRPVALTPSRANNAKFGAIELIGVDMPGQVNVGDALPITFYWRALETPTEDTTIELRFAGESGPVIYQKTITPTRPDFGTSQWKAGDEWIGFADVPVPVDLSSGQYLLAASGPDDVLVLERIEVTAPERVFIPPMVAHPLDVQFDGLARLLGWDAEPGQLTLYWQALKTAGTSYKVFVHALDSNGNIIAQHDSPPADGARPTTSWLPPEIIIDSRPLTLPPDTTAIRVGLYDPATGQRLRLPDGSEFVTFKP